MTTLQRATSAAAVGLLAAGALHAQAAEPGLRAALQQRIAAASGATVGLYFRDLVRGDTITLNADARFHAASTMKLPIMLQLYRDVDAGVLPLRAKIPVTNSFRSIADSSVYQLNAADDSDSSLYRKVGQEVALGEMIELMITRSSNLAANILIERAGPARIQATLHQLGADSVRVLRGVEDNAAYRAGLNNTTTARGLGDLLAAIAEARAASAQSCGEMLRILMRQRFNDGIPAGLPRHTRVAHKTGWITALHHDAAIVYEGNRPRYVLVVLTRGLQEQSQSAALMADLARTIHTALFPPPPPAQTAR